MFRKVKISSEVSISSFHIETWKAWILTTRWRKQVDEINIQFLNICVNSSNRSAQKFECRKYLNMCQDTLQLSVHIFSPFFPRFNFKSKLRFGFHMAYSWLVYSVVILNRHLCYGYNFGAISKLLRVRLLTVHPGWFK